MSSAMISSVSYFLAFLASVAVGADVAPVETPTGTSKERLFHSEAWWRQQAENNIRQIADDDARGRAIHDFTWVRVRAGDVEGASAAAPEIGNTQLRIYAHLAIAKHYRLRGDMKACVDELERARPVVLADRGSYQMIDAYLDYAESVELARSFVLSIEDQRYRAMQMRSLAEGLATRGQLDEALTLVDKYVTDNKQQALAGMARASGTVGHVKQVEKLTAMLTDIKQRDAAWKNLIDRLAREGRHNEAKQLVNHISNPVLQARANAAIDQVDGRSVAKISADALRKRIDQTSTREEKRVLQDTLLKKLLAEKNAAGATQVIESMVESIRESPREPRHTRFGITDDETEVAAARSWYVDVAKVLARQGDEEASRKALAKGRQAVLDIPDAANLTKMVFVAKLVEAQLELGDREGVLDTLRAVKPFYLTAISGHSAVAIIRNGGLQIGLELAELTLSTGHAGRQIGSVVVELIHRGESDAARGLLVRIGDGRQQIEAFREFGSGMIKLGLARELYSWLEDSNSVARAHACIGAAATLRERVGCPPSSSEERAVVEYLTIPPESLPNGFSLDRAHVPPDSTITANPGVYPKNTLPTFIEHFQSHRRGQFVPTENAFRAVYRHEHSGVDVMIQGFTFPDAETARRIRSQISGRSFADWHFHKGRMIFYVSGHGQDVASAREAIQEFLEKRQLSGNE